MASYTIRLAETIAEIFAEDDPDDYEQTYSEMTFANTTYGKLPTVPDPKQLGLGTYPIFNENYRQILNGKIIDEYFLREIGFETIDIFQQSMRKKMDQIMPYYNQLYSTESMVYDPFMTMNIHSVNSSKLNAEATSTSENTANSASTGKSRAVNSTTPQNPLSGDEDYASGLADANSQNTSDTTANNTSNSENNTDSDSDTRVTGFQGIQSELMVRYRNSLINIDTMILREIEDCFMLIYNSGDSYTKQGWIY